MTDGTHPNDAWSRVMFNHFKSAGVTLFSYIPDAGNARLAELVDEDNECTLVMLTTEEEGVALAAGADLVGKQAVLMMQSSGVGNCPNFLSFVKGANFPILLMVSMRGDYGEQNPWQYPMGEAADAILEAMGLQVIRIDRKEDLEAGLAAGTNAVFKAGRSAAIVLTQQFLGAKPF